MKNIVLAILAFALAFTLGCSTSDGPGGGSSGSNDNLTLSGQVYTLDMDLDMDLGTMNFVYVPYTSPNLTFTSNTGSNGSITNGNLSFSTGVPASSILEPPDDDFDPDSDVYSDLTIQPSDALGISLEFLNIELSKQYTEMNINMATGSVTMASDAVTYLYVDRDCRMTATGGLDEDGITYSNLDLNLRKGWNAINMKIRATTVTTNCGGITNCIGGSTTTGTFAMNIGDLPNVKWVLGDDSDDDWSSAQLFKTAKLGLKKAVIKANKKRGL